MWGIGRAWYNGNMDKKNLIIFEYKLPVVVEKEKDGYVATCPIWNACYAQGDMLEEAINEISYVASSLVEMYKEEGLSVPLELKETKKQKKSSAFFFNFP